MELKHLSEIERATKPGRNELARLGIALLFIVGHFWPRDEDAAERDKSWAAGIGVEMLF